ncbi:hypothetical protein RHMOL_Rhmol08G0140200 [Rhododendron molle]|uniref:Uncharacterized protein n=1 Tax=Rhododendron molle TaxID=49168 RepID=A0ACC0MPR8_RHOML|nr:hypothetical protein RHMOL_Rhmol08G0140200 [Rhododendron molle]
MRRVEEEVFVALNMYIHAAMGVFRLYCFIVSTAQYSRPELSPNLNYYQTQVDVVNKLVNGNEVDCHEQLRGNPKKAKEVGGKRFTYFDD